MCKDNNNMELYNEFRKCPSEAQKQIQAGRLKGKTDINPMWRIKKLTEMFGPCGIGWTCRITETWLSYPVEGGETIANVRCELKYKYNGEWSQPVEGIGGAMFVTEEKSGRYVDDDCFKKAYTDAMSVACKAIGIAADIYYAKDPETKYMGTDAPVQPPIEPEITFADALSYVYKEGKYPDKPLSYVYKNDIAYINELGKSPDTPQEIVKMLCIINEGIKKANEQKQ